MRGAAQAVVDRLADAVVGDRARPRSRAWPTASARCSASNRSAAASVRSPLADRVVVAGDRRRSRSSIRRRRRAARRSAGLARGVVAEQLARRLDRVGRRRSPVSKRSSFALAARQRRAAPASPVIGPWRRMRVIPNTSRTIVDSIPCRVGPSSRISGMRPSRLCATCSARVGLIVPAGIGRGRGERLAARFEQRAHRAVRGHADRDRLEPRGHQRGDPRRRLERQHQRQRPRPERRGQRLGARVERRELLRRGEVEHVDDQRIEARPPLGGIDRAPPPRRRSRRRRGRRPSRSAPRRTCPPRSAPPLRRCCACCRARFGCLARPSPRGYSARESGEEADALHPRRPRTAFRARPCRADRRSRRDRALRRRDARSGRCRAGGRRRSSPRANGRRSTARATPTARNGPPRA